MGYNRTASFLLNLKILFVGAFTVKKINPRILHLVGILLSLGVFGLLLAFTQAFLYEAPYPGFYFNGTDGRIAEFYGEAESRDLLRVGDVLKSVGGVSMEEFLADGTTQFFKDIQPGETVEIIALRDGEEITVAWVMPGYSREEFMTRFLNPWWLAYFFWGIGFAAQLFMRPRNASWRLLIALNEIIGFWLVLGSASSLRIWNASPLFHAITWLALPVLLNLHWIFPRPLKPIPNWGWALFYLFCGGLAVSEILHLLPRNLFFLGVMLMFGGSIILLFLHLRHAQDRRASQLLLLSIVFALLPTIGASLSGLAGRVPEIGVLGVFSLPFMPVAYAFVIIRQQAGGMEMRFGRIVSIYAFLIFLGTVLLASSGFVSAGGAVASPLLTIILAGLAAALISISGFPLFQRFLDKRFLGISLPYQNLLETYSSRIATSASIASLLRVLEEDVFPSLLVRQYAFMQLSGDELCAAIVKNVDAQQLPGPYAANELTSLAGRFRLPETGQPHPWARLILPLQAGDTLLGFWLLGRRDPDDLYHAAELPIFQSLADQTAIAVSNLLQEERLRSLYQSDIQRREQERLTLARGLHDSVLNQLAVLRMNLGDTNPSPRFEQAYEEVVQRLREIVSELRPPMLNYGLKLALEELTQNLMERSEGRARVSLAMFGEEERYPANIELHLFRIVQEACENALRHAKAAYVFISANLNATGVNLEIKDDGHGFEMGERMELDELLIRKHFGLAGIVERANLIGAQASIQSAPETGTRVRVVWRAPVEGQG